jgi:hypothetical protein
MSGSSTATLSAQDLAALIRCADVLLSLHRAEGFGLFIAEAMWLGTAVIATGWSGVLDMLDADNAMLVGFNKVAVKPGDYPSVPPGAQWADPDVGHAAECLRRLASDASLRISSAPRPAHGPSVNSASTLPRDSRRPAAGVAKKKRRGSASGAPVATPRGQGGKSRWVRRSVRSLRRRRRRHELHDPRGFGLEQLTGLVAADADPRVGDAGVVLDLRALARGERDVVERTNLDALLGSRPN